MKLNPWEIKHREMIRKRGLENNPLVKFSSETDHTWLRYIAREAFDLRLYLSNGELKDWLFEHDLIECLVTCRIQDNLIGIGVRRLNKESSYDRTNGFFVKPAYRRLGIGSKLFEMLKSYGVQNVTYGTLSGHDFYMEMLQRHPDSCELI